MQCGINKTFYKYVVRKINSFSSLFTQILPSKILKLNSKNRVQILNYSVIEVQMTLVPQNEPLLVSLCH